MCFVNALCTLQESKNGGSGGNNRNEEGKEKRKAMPELLHIHPP